MRIFIGCTLVLAACALASPIHAQPTGEQFMQASFGISTSAGGNYVERDEYVADYFLGRVIKLRKEPVLVGGSIGVNFVNGSDLTCRATPGGGCAPTMPRLGYATILVGNEVGGIMGSAGVVGGPALLWGRKSSRLGAQIRADFASPSLYHVSLVFSPRLLVAPNVDGATLTLRSLSVGLRVR